MSCPAPWELLGEVLEHFVASSWPQTPFEGQETA
jgi:hypothetical protein